MTPEERQKDWDNFLTVRRGLKKFKHSVSFRAWVESLNHFLAERGAGSYKDYLYKNYRQDYRNGISANSLAQYIFDNRHQMIKTR